MLKQLIKSLHNLVLEFKKSLARALGQKYVRTGKCKACGRCCQKIYVRHSKSIIKDEEEFQRLIPQHFFYSYLKVIGKDETGLIFECTKLDKEAGKCKAYKKRAFICRKYPQEEVFMMGGVISDTCGFKFIPATSFEKVFNKVQKEYNRKHD